MDEWIVRKLSLMDECSQSAMGRSTEALCWWHESTVVELGGIEPPTSCMPCKRSPS